MNPRPENFTVIDGYSLANPFERILALLIDIIVFSIIYGVLYAALWLFNLSSLAAVIAVLYLIFRDSFAFLDYQSIGKKVMKLRVIKTDDRMKVTIADALKRNFIFLPNLLNAFGVSFIFAGGTITLILILIELYLMYTSTDHQRLGDQFADTQVIENSF